MPERLPRPTACRWKVYDDQAIATDIARARDHRQRAPRTSSSLADPTSTLYQNAFLPDSADEFATDVAAGTLPSVSWIIPAGRSGRAPAGVAPGRRGVHQRACSSTLLANPAVWAKTVLFVTYDENGGFFDHVAPPVAPPGTAGE